MCYLRARSETHGNAWRATLCRPATVAFVTKRNAFHSQILSAFGVDTSSSDSAASA